jgi:hypothetical protein
MHTIILIIKSVKWNQKMESKGDIEQLSKNIIPQTENFDHTFWITIVLLHIECYHL